VAKGHLTVGSALESWKTTRCQGVRTGSKLTTPLILDPYLYYRGVGACTSCRWWHWLEFLSNVMLGVLYVCSKSEREKFENAME
jgi:hypothetical protein